MLGFFNAHKEYAGSSRNHFFLSQARQAHFPEEIYACF